MSVTTTLTALRVATVTCVTLERRGFNGRQIITAALFGLRTIAFAYYLGGRLVPDTALYSSGKACWSSPAACSVGYIFGYRGIFWLSAISALVLGGYLAYLKWWRILTVFATPPGWCVMLASPDGLGGLAAGYYWKNKRSFLTAFTMIAICHLEAALVYMCVRLAHGIKYFPKVLLPYSGFIAGIAACFGQWHFQMRYLFPGLIIWAVYKK